MRPCPDSMVGACLISRLLTPRAARGPSREAFRRTDHTPTGRGGTADASVRYLGVRTFLHPVRIVRIMQNSSPVSGSQALPRYLVRGEPPNGRARPCGAPTRLPRPRAPPLFPPCRPNPTPRRRCAGRGSPTRPARTRSDATSCDRGNAARCSRPSRGAGGWRT